MGCRSLGRGTECRCTEAWLVAHTVYHLQSSFRNPCGIFKCLFRTIATCAGVLLFVGKISDMTFDVCLGSNYGLAWFQSLAGELWLVRGITMGARTGAGLAHSAPWTHLTPGCWGPAQCHLAATTVLPPGEVNRPWLSTTILRHVNHCIYLLS